MGSDVSDGVFYVMHHEWINDYFDFANDHIYDVVNNLQHEGVQQITVPAAG